MTGSMIVGTLVVLIVLSIAAVNLIRILLGKD